LELNQDQVFGVRARKEEMNAIKAPPSRERRNLERKEAKRLLNEALSSA
jgi:hypothetical protein